MTGLLFLIIDFGLCEAVVKTETVKDENLVFVYSFGVSVALILSSLLFFGKDLISQYLKIENSWLFAIVNSSIIVLYSRSSLHLALRRKDFKYSSILYITLVATFASISCAFILIEYNQFEYSLPAYAVTYHVVVTAWLLFNEKKIPIGRLNFSQNKSLFIYGRERISTQLIFFAASRMPEFLIAFLFGPSALAVYVIGSRLYDALMQLLCYSLVDVSHNIFSQLSRSREQLTKYFIEIVKKSIRLSSPIFVFVALNAKYFVIILFGSKWLGSVYVLQCLCFSAAIQVLDIFNVALFNALGKTFLSLKITTCKLLALILMLVFFHASIDQIVSVFCFIQVISIAPNLLFVRAEMPEAMKTLSSIFLKTFASLTVATVFTLIFDSYISIILNNNIFAIIGSAIVFFLFYFFVLLYFFKENVFSELIK